MSTTARLPRLLLAATFSVLAAVGCNGGISENSGNAAAEPGTESRDPAKSAKNAEPIKKAQLGKGVWLETQGKRRRVLVAAEVCLREGFGLECLLCKKHTKEHESILTTEADARIIHFGLVAAGAEPGSPVKYVEKGDKYITVPPSGSPIMVSLQYAKKDGKVITMPAREWVRHGKTNRHLKGDWVFAGSLEYPHPEDQKKKIYAANSDGAYICVLNVPSAMLDLPLDNPKRPPEERELEPYTDRIPPLETNVTVILEPVAEKKPAKK